MAKKSSPTFQKREKERARQQKQKDKEARRIESKMRKANTAPRIEGEDPDIAGIRPGPQPLPQDDYAHDRGPEFMKEVQDENM